MQNAGTIQSSEQLRRERQFLEFVPFKALLIAGDLEDPEQVLGDPTP